MTKNSMCVLKGIGIAMLAGGLVGFASGQIVGSQKKHKKKTAKAVGDILDNVHSMLK